VLGGWYRVLYTAFVNSVVGANDRRDQGMAHNIYIAKRAKFNARDACQQTLGF
jgi:hypothetical protein